MNAKLWHKLSKLSLRPIAIHKNCLQYVVMIVYKLINLKVYWVLKLNSSSIRFAILWNFQGMGWNLHCWIKRYYTFIRKMIDLKD